jgi:hypothetical protein
MAGPPKLLPGVKNYWFVWGADGEAQFVFTWGTVRHPFKVNGGSPRYPRQALLAWGYHPKEGKKVLFNGVREMEHPPRGEFNFETGDVCCLSYGDTEVTFGDKYEETTPFPRKGPCMGWNEFRKFKGKLFGHRVEGRSLMQRYGVWTPFVSWDWLSFFCPEHGDLFRLLNMPSAFSLGGKEYPVRFSAGGGRLRLQSDEVDLSTEPYASEDVRMTGIGKFHYTEFFVHVSGKVGGRDVNGHGIVEEARGFIV